jgi:ABC-2 type transport system ATP-binding protein
MLLFENIKKYYGSFLALEIPSLSVEKGLWWLQGENGSGKTTFLKMIAGLHPFTGNVILAENLSLKKQRQQYVKAVNYAEAEPLYPTFLTAKDLVDLFCYTKGGSITSAQEMLKQLHVYEEYNQPIGSYSSGMIKKVSLTLAFIGNPKIILLDEPLITIDTQAVDVICRIIKARSKEGISFIISSHQEIDTSRLDFTGTLYVENRIIVKKVNDYSNQNIAKGIG